MAEPTTPTPGDLKIMAYDVAAQMDRHRAAYAQLQAELNRLNGEIAKAEQAAQQPQQPAPDKPAERKSKK